MFLKLRPGHVAPSSGDEYHPLWLDQQKYSFLRHFKLWSMTVFLKKWFIERYWIYSQIGCSVCSSGCSDWRSQRKYYALKNMRGWTAAAHRWPFPVWQAYLSSAAGLRDGSWLADARGIWSVLSGLSLMHCVCYFHSGFYREGTYFLSVCSRFFKYR